LGSYPFFAETREAFGKRWAFYAPDIFEGQWWRAFSYLFVHANALHLLMNMGGLWVLGPFVERAFGRLRFSVIYLISGCTGSAVYLILTRLGVVRPEELVGASGCIMGLLGATGAIMLRAWVRQRAPVARQIFFRLLLVVALQVYFDQTTPEIAGLAHALGLLGGFVSALLLNEAVTPRESVQRV
jgi:rhomboid protease GluP